MSTFQQRIQTKTKGFTIVELLIVIVVIAILAAIGIVAYTGVQSRAHNSAVQQDLRNMGQIFELYRTEHGYYPTSHPSNDANMSELGLRVTRGSYDPESFVSSQHNLFYCHPSNGAGDIALIAMATAGNVWYYNNQSGRVSEYDIENTNTASVTTICAAAGVSDTQNAASHLTRLRNNNGWVSWVQ